MEGKTRGVGKHAGSVLACFSKDIAQWLNIPNINYSQTQEEIVLSETELISSINEKNGVAILYGYYDENNQWSNGHWCVVGGFIKSSDNTEIIFERIDPLGGIREFISYESLKKYDSTRRWFETAY